MVADLRVPVDICQHLRHSENVVALDSKMRQDLDHQAIKGCYQRYLYKLVKVNWVSGFATNKYILVIDFHSNYCFSEYLVYTYIHILRDML